MSASNSINCFLCQSDAAIGARPNFGRYMAISCTSCGHYVLSENAASRIAGLPSAFKDKWRAMIASAAPEEVLLIIVEPVGAGGGLKDELVPRTSLQL